MQANQRRDFSSSENHISSLLHQHLRLLTVAEAQLHLARPSVSQLASVGHLARSSQGPQPLQYSWPPAGQKSRVNRGWPGIGGGGLKASRLLQTDGPQQ